MMAGDDEPERIFQQATIFYKAQAVLRKKKPDDRDEEEALTITICFLQAFFIPGASPGHTWRTVRSLLLHIRETSSARGALVVATGIPPTVLVVRLPGSRCCFLLRGAASCGVPLHDLGNQAREGLKSGPLFVYKVVSAIHPSHAGDGVAERGLDHMRQHPRALHQRGPRSPQVMQGPVRDVGELVQGGLPPGPGAVGRIAPGAQGSTTIVR